MILEFDTIALRARLAPVVPAEAETQCCKDWIPAFAGMAIKILTP